MHTIKIGLFSLQEKKYSYKAKRNSVNFFFLCTAPDTT